MPPSGLARSLLIRIGTGEQPRITVQDLGTGERTTFASWEAFLSYAEGRDPPADRSDREP